MTTVREVMTEDVVRVSPELSLRQLAELLASKHLCSVAVIEGGRLSGVATAGDVLDAVANIPNAPPARGGPEYGNLPLEKEADEDQAEDRPTASFYGEMFEDAGADVATRLDESDSPEWDVLDEHTVGEAMSRKLHTIGPDASLTEAARKMDSLGIQRLLVTENGDLLGIVSTSDISRSVAQAGPARRAKAARIGVRGTSARVRGQGSR